MLYTLYTEKKKKRQFEKVCQELSLLIIKLTTLKQKLIQWFITFKIDFYT